MKSLKSLVTLALVSLFAAGLALASEAKKETAAEVKTPKCCAAAAKEGKKCEHSCCVEAAKAGKTCEKCPAAKPETKK